MIYIHYTHTDSGRDKVLCTRTTLVETVNAVIQAGYTITSVEELNP